jgi:hypothetical protein
MAQQRLHLGCSGLPIQYLIASICTKRHTCPPAKMSEADRAGECRPRILECDRLNRTLRNVKDANLQFKNGSHLVAFL